MFQSRIDFTILEPLSDQCLSELRICLEDPNFAAELESSLACKMGNNLIHFVRFTILPATLNCTARLLCSMIIDDECAVQNLPAPVRRPLEICWKARGEGHPQLHHWLHDRRIHNCNMFVAAVGETVRSIRSGSARYDYIQATLDQKTGNAANGQIPHYIKEVREATASSRFPSGLSKQQKLSRRTEFIGGVLFTMLPAWIAVGFYLRSNSPQSGLQLICWVVVANAVWAAMLAFTIGVGWRKLLQWFNRDAGNPSFVPIDFNPPSPAVWSQNKVTLSLTVRDNAMCRFSLRMYLGFAQWILTYWYSAGQLAGVNSIHFARFFLIDGGRRMLFLSDFDGATDNYLAEFVSVGRLAIIPILMHLDGCPPTKGFFKPGETFAQQLPSYVLENSIPTVAASAYPHLSVRNVLSRSRLNTAIDLDNVAAIRTHMATCR